MKSNYKQPEPKLQELAVPLSTLHQNGILVGYTVDGYYPPTNFTFNITNNKEYQQVARERDHAQKALKALLELEPALERYTYTVTEKQGEFSSTLWDVEGMQRALKFRADEAIAKKYTDTKAVK